MENFVVNSLEMWRDHCDSSKGNEMFVIPFVLVCQYSWLFLNVVSAFVFSCQKKFGSLAVILKTYDSRAGILIAACWQIFKWLSRECFWEVIVRWE